MRRLLLNLFVLTLLPSALFAAVERGSLNLSDALRMAERNMNSRSSILLQELSLKEKSITPLEYSVLMDVKMNVPNYESKMEDFIRKNSHSTLIPVILYSHAMNLFAEGDYAAAGDVLDGLTLKQIYKSDQSSFLFKKAYCLLCQDRITEAEPLLLDLEKRPKSDYTAPARYALGYIRYQMKDFHTALGWFEKVYREKRFEDIASFYMLECRFMLHDYKFVTQYGEKMYEKVPNERKQHLARLISESYLVLSDPANAKRFYELSLTDDTQERSRTDWFYSGSVLYAVRDYRGAIEAFEMMDMRTDSLGQIANYHLGYSYIQTRNKVAALNAFRDASLARYDEDMARDAYLNYAKLAFDLNHDNSVFADYLKHYPDSAQSDRINSYIALAALYDRDYEAAVEAYDKIDELDEDMKFNYMKANYLRASQLVSSGSYRKAVPLLKAASYYSERGTRFNQLSRYWLAECYYRNDQFQQAKEIFVDLFNTSALYGMTESSLLPYNIAYCNYKNAEYETAVKWFTTYLQEPTVIFRKDALLRRADCRYVAKKYEEALADYDKVTTTYFDVNDIYPYYQAAMCHGLTGDDASKVKLLSNVLSASAQSAFYPEAMYELGRTYEVMEKDEQAMDCFSRIVTQVRDSTFIAKAYLEMGSVARNLSQYNEALSYYKTVVEKLPHSGSADDALLAIESIYQTRNEPQAYLDYLESIGKGAVKTPDEKERLFFNSAEQVFLSENYTKALQALLDYKSRYPQGAAAYKADFYIAQCYRNLGKDEQACDYYKKVVVSGTGSFVELSTLGFAQLSYKLERWDDAYDAYASLFSSAKIENNRATAIVGMMRSAFKGHHWNDAISVADRLLGGLTNEEAILREALYVKAKSCLASSRRAEAFKILGELSQNMNDSYGAEAAYLLILDSYDSGDFDAVQTRVFAFSDASSPEIYWFAKSLIVLGDSYVEKGELRQARATFESIRDGYESSGDGDDVLENVNMRLRKLAELE